MSLLWAGFFFGCLPFLCLCFLLVFFFLLIFKRLKSVQSFLCCTFSISCLKALNYIQLLLDNLSTGRFLRTSPGLGMVYGVRLLVPASGAGLSLMGIRCPEQGEWPWLWN